MEENQEDYLFFFLLETYLYILPVLREAFNLDH